MCIRLSDFALGVAPLQGLPDLWDQRSAVVFSTSRQPAVGFPGACGLLPPPPVVPAPRSSLPARLVLPGMRRQGGPIVNVSTIGGRLTSPGGCYHASKQALEALSDALRFEVRPLGIDVVVIELGSFARASPRPRSTVWNPSPGRDPTGPATRLSRMRRQMPGVERDGEARRPSRGRRHAIEPAITARHPGRAARSLLGTAAVTWCAAADHALGPPPRQSFPSPRTRSEAKEQAEESGCQTRQARERPERKPEGGRSP